MEYAPHSASQKQCSRFKNFGFRNRESHFHISRHRHQDRVRQSFPPGSRRVKIALFVGVFRGNLSDSTTRLQAGRKTVRYRIRTECLFVDILLAAQTKLPTTFCELGFPGREGFSVPVVIFPGCFP